MTTKPALIFSPNCKDTLDDFLLEVENQNEFIERLEAILFSDYCVLLYSPTQQAYIIDVMEILGLGELIYLFQGILEGQRGNVREINENSSEFSFSNFNKNTGQSTEVTDKTFFLNEYFHHEHIAGIEFSSKSTLKTIEIIRFDRYKENSKSALIVIPSLNSYCEYLNWVNSLHQKTFDETYQKHLFKEKTKKNKKEVKGHPNSLKCDLSEAIEILPYAFFRDADHENHLFFYHLDPKDDTPIIFYKTSSHEGPISNNYHAYHISETDVRQKNVDPQKLRNLSNYVNKQLSS